MRIKNWAKFQHFKDRKPPWIKLYRDLLDDIEWHLLDAEASKLLVMLWLIASEDAGELPDIKILAFRLRMSEQQVNDCVSRLGHWIEQGDIKPISSRYQCVPATELKNSATVDLTLGETETETETETEEEREKEEEKKEPRKRDSSPVCPTEVDQQTWTDWLKLRKAKKAPVTETVVNAAIREADKAGMTLETFLQVWCARGSQGLEASWLKDSERTHHSKSFAELDRENGMRRWEEMTGRQHPDRINGAREVQSEVRNVIAIGCN